ncbi:unnamed protein product [Adineta steineri]|uniref:Uncharacterized protein n=1 Tax=Adineta steineri TaxID=433720 RepID=A0A814FJ58_9BILA|nr:unnamed protein product [Adineta steineri]CAF1009918.1 unnamed protein product [Adineta steineri]CAF1061936.1 unnamed protein product [Adineta steineri]
MIRSPSYWSDDDYPLNEIKTRIVWITDYTNNDNFPINVPIDDPLLQFVNTSSNEKDDISLFNKIHNVNLSKLNLDDLILLLYRLQQQTNKNSVKTSGSPMYSSSSLSSSSSSSDIIEHKPSYSHSINRPRSSFTLSDLADVPKQLTTTLAKPTSSFHSQNTKHIHSPNDVVNKLLQSFNIHNNKNQQKFIKYNSQRHLPRYTYQACQQHKAKLLSTLRSSNSNGSFRYYVHQNKSYH